MQKRMFNFLCCTVLLLTVSACVTPTENVKKKTNKNQSTGMIHSVQTITPIYDQLIVFSMPNNFRPVYEEDSGIEYIRESVPKGESAKRWTEMITVTGIKGAALAPFGSLNFFTSLVVQTFSGTCPSTYSSEKLEVTEINGYKAFAVVSSCGTLKGFGQSYNEAALIITIAGKNNFYSIQWAERGVASASAISIDKKKWVERLAQLTPKVCPRVSGEVAPYPSCLDQGDSK